jgi:hypothetical protein
LFQERYRKYNYAIAEKFERKRVLQMSTKMQQRNQIIEWHRTKVMELLNKDEAISQRLKVFLT